MARPDDIQNALAKVRDQRSFIQRLLIDGLGWEIPTEAESLDEISFGWTADELRAQDLDKALLGGQVSQLQRLRADQPWGIFLLEFARPDVFETGRGMSGPLRRVLRGLVPSRRRQSNLQSWRRENLLFICTHNYQHYRFAYFKAPRDGSKTAPLASFAWGPDVPARTACEFNLPALEWPDAGATPEAWVAAWAGAFDVEKVTKKFYEHYATVFADLEGRIRKTSKLTGEELRLFTQSLFNRLMFLRFIERKGWLTYEDDRNYLRALHKAGPVGRQSFYRSRLCPLFFEGLAVEGRQQSDAIGSVPFLNGGLFERSALDDKVQDIPDEAFEGIIGRDGLFYRFNFTVEESTPLDIEVAVDPEMLGKVFEELVTGRHESGSYYTPRPVVSFMCREALKGVLAEKTGASDAAVAALVDEHEVRGLSESHARAILQALDDLKAVDPACGSGAYLLGLLHEMIAIYRLLQSEKLVKDSRSLYDLKLRIISQNLYGVDIDPFATSIAMLRLWLSLAVEAQEAVPLPNLDFKIETGDSLLAPDPQDMPDLFRGLLQAQANALTNAKSLFLKAHGTEKNELRELIRSTEERLRVSLREYYEADVVDWRIQFAEVFARPSRGFDIVLANPPYVRKEQIPQHVKAILLERYGNAITGRSDLYCSFYARGIQLLGSRGMHVMVCSSSWLDAGYGAILQAHLLQTCRIRAIFDSAVEKQFSSANVNTIISVLQQDKSPMKSTARFVLFNASFDRSTSDPDARAETEIRQDLLWSFGLSDKSYIGNKWGGKLLRAPRIYNRIFVDMADRFVPLSDLAEVSGYIHDNSTGESHSTRRVLWTIRDAESIQITPDTPGVRSVGVKPSGNSTTFAPIVFPRTFGTRHLIPWLRGGVLGKEFYKVLPRDAKDEVSLVAQLNSTLGILQREILGIKGLGGGALKFAANDVMQFQVIPDLPLPSVLVALKALVGRRIEDIPNELHRKDRRILDALIFDFLGLSREEREMVYAETERLVDGRRSKAKRAIG